MLSLYKVKILKSNRTWFGGFHCFTKHCISWFCFFVVLLPESYEITFLFLIINSIYHYHPTFISSFLHFSSRYFSSNLTSSWSSLFCSSKTSIRLRYRELAADHRDSRRFISSCNSATWKCLWLTRVVWVPTSGHSKHTTRKSSYHNEKCSSYGAIELHKTECKWNT